MISLQANNLAQDLVRFHRVITGGRCITAQDEGASPAVSLIYIHYAMGNEAGPEAIEDNVSPLELGWRHRLNRDHVIMANGGMHACSRRSKTHPETKAQQLST